MVVGTTGSGKTVAINELMKAQNYLGYATKSVYVNPKVHNIFACRGYFYMNLLQALEVDELYGYFENEGHDWIDGLLANIMRNYDETNEVEVIFKKEY